MLQALLENFGQLTVLQALLENFGQLTVLQALLEDFCQLTVLQALHGRGSRAPGGHAHSCHLARRAHSQRPRQGSLLFWWTKQVDRLFVVNAEMRVAGIPRSSATCVAGKF